MLINDNHLKFQQWGSNKTNNIDGAEAVRVAHNAILVSRMHLATIALLCKETTDNFRTRHPPEPRWRHLLGNRILFVPHYSQLLQKRNYMLYFFSWDFTILYKPEDKCRKNIQR